MAPKRYIVFFFFALLAVLLMGCSNTKAAFEFSDWPDSVLPDVPAMHSLDGKIVEIRNENSTEGYTYKVISLWDNQYQDVNDYMDLLLVDGWQDNTFISSSDISLPVYWSASNIDSPASISHDFTHCGKVEQFSCTMDVGSISIGRVWDLIPKYSEDNQYYLEIEVSWISSR